MRSRAPTATRYATLMREVCAHVKEEEGEVFVQMRTVFSGDGLVGLVVKAASVNQMAPTRRHPTAPDGPWRRLALAEGADDGSHLVEEHLEAGFFDREVSCAGELDASDLDG